MKISNSAVSLNYTYAPLGNRLEKIWVKTKYCTPPPCMLYFGEITYRTDSTKYSHNTQSNIKLDLSNGKCYKKREYVFSINEKSLLAIREKALKVYKGDLPPLRIA
jgi:hypothetical protein